MKDVEEIKIIIETEVVELYLNKVEKIFYFKPYCFEECETIEEIRDKFYNNLGEEYVLKHIDIYLLDKNKKQIEYLGEWLKWNQKFVNEFWR